MVIVCVVCVVIVSVAFHGHTLLSDPSMKPDNMASVWFGYFLRVYASSREKVVMPIIAPNAKVVSVMMSSVLTASMM